VSQPAHWWRGKWPEYEACGVRYVPVTRKTKGDMMTFYYRKPSGPKDAR
jgi:hypothetical protein